MRVDHRVLYRPASAPRDPPGRVAEHAERRHGARLDASASRIRSGEPDENDRTRQADDAGVGDDHGILQGGDEEQAPFLSRRNSSWCATPQWCRADSATARR